ncbi:FtsX-like permease family protein [Paenibacillus sp. sgz500958]|uniref:FtsX-like permease family protein n=1 Tax=Paenibacillus sp. sgz500958 TaxID=3242475 RepID=UPI0036D23A19
MFYLRTGILNIYRNKFKSILNILICALIVSLLNLYISSIETNKKQLSNLVVALPVSAHITNSDGSQNVGLEIKKESILQLQSSQYVSGLTYATQLMAGLGDYPMDEWEKYLNISVASVNSIRAIPALPLENVALASGATLDYLQSKEAQCLADEQLLRQNKLAVGDTIVLKLNYYRYAPDGIELRLKPLGVYSFKIIGSMAPWNELSSGLVAQVILPTSWTEEAFAKADTEFYADSAAFTVKDPRKLNAFKSQMQKYGFKSVQASAPLSHNGNALLVNDGDFIKAAGHLKENLSLLTSFFYLILMIVACTGYITSYLLKQNRRPEFAVMRSLGSSKRACFAALITESLALMIVGVMLGTIVVTLFSTDKLTAIPAMITMFFFMLGNIIALLFLSRFSVMAILCRND